MAAKGGRMDGAQDKCECHMFLTSAERVLGFLHAYLMGVGIVAGGRAGVDRVSGAVIAVRGRGNGSA